MDRTLRLTFDEVGDYVLRLSPVPMDDYFAISEAWDTARAKDRDALDDYRALFRTFGDAGVIESWPHEEKPDGAGMLRRDFKLALVVVSSWLAEVGKVPLPLPVSASGGTPSTSEASPQP
jgi:hypothetical protein